MIAIMHTLTNEQKVAYEAQFSQDILVLDQEIEDGYHKSYV